jgi:ectoine hydroxylase-related dioxygenase (phytanoyl-CoA dioxygenase family)
MSPEDVLAHPPRVLSQTQRESYFNEGYLLAEAVVSKMWIERLLAASQALIDYSRTITESDKSFELGPAHSAQTPHVRRLKALVDRDPVFWEFASASELAEVAADLVGPDVKFHSSKMNYKSPGDGEVVKWHQDIPAWPHTNYSPVTLGVHLGDVSDEHGPLLCIPGSHDGPLFVHRDDSGAWTGSVSDADLASVDLDRVFSLCGAAGTVVAINCRTIHGSDDNRSSIVRPLPLFIYSSADAFAWMPPPSPTSHTGDIVRGEQAKFAHLDPRPCPVPPNWAHQGYGSIFRAQKVR